MFERQVMEGTVAKVRGDTAGWRDQTEKYEGRVRAALAEANRDERVQLVEGGLSGKTRRGSDLMFMRPRREGALLCGPDAGQLGGLARDIVRRQVKRGACLAVEAIEVLEARDEDRYFVHVGYVYSTRKQKK